MIPGVRALLAATSFRWGVNTVASLVVNVGVTAGLHEGLGVATEAAYAAGLVTVFVMNFFFFRYYVFSRESPVPLGAQLAAYTGSAVGFRATEYLGFLLVHSLLGLQYILSIFLVQGGTFVAKFFFYGRVVFRERADG